MPRKNRRKARSAGKQAPVKPPVKPVGLFVTSDLEIAIESCRKEVESIAKSCRARNVKFRDRDFDLHYDTFRCINGYTSSSLVNSAKKDVQRVTEIFDEPHFFPEGGVITSNGIVQGSLGDCYFLSALATVSCIPSLIEKICVARDEAVGVYGFIFYSDHGWSRVIIDDLLLTKAAKFEELDSDSRALYHNDKDRYESVARKGGKVLLFAKAGSQNEMWVPLIEKAYAKHYGNFSHIEGGFTNEAVEDLTGGVSMTFISKDILDIDRFWKEELENVNKDRVFACSFQTLNAPDEDPFNVPVVEGLYGSHAYAVLRAVEVKGKRFVIVRNPWGNGEWTGRWSDGSKEWTQEWVEILPQLGHSFGNDGQFVMEYKDFLRCFERLQRTFLFDDSWVAASLWTEVPLGDRPRAWGWGTLTYDVDIPEKTKTIFSLSRLNGRFFDSIKTSSAVSIEYAVVKHGDLEPLATVAEWRPFHSRSVTLELELDPGKYHVYVRFDREKGDEGYNYEGVTGSTRVISRVVSARVYAQSIAEEWNSNLVDAFIPKGLQEVIADDLLEETADDGDAKGSVEGEKAAEGEGEDEKSEPSPDADNEKKGKDEEKAEEEVTGSKDGEKAEGVEADAEKSAEGEGDGEKKEKDGEEGEKEGEEDVSGDGEGPHEDIPDHSWEEFLKDEGTNIFVGLRVYTKTKEPATLVPFLRCEGGKNCSCGKCD